MYGRKFCISLIIRSWDEKISIFFLFFFYLFIFFLGGGCSLDFHEGQLFVIYLFKSQKAFRMSTLFECRYLEDNFLVQSSDFCIHKYKICFCKEVYISPYPKIVIFKNSCAIEEVAVLPNMMADLPILHFRNHWHYSFLENISFALFYSFLCQQQRYIFAYVYEIKFNKIKTNLFQCHVAHSLHQNAWLRPDSYESWENLL